MTKLIIQTSRKTMGNMQINTETLSVQQPEIKTMLKGEDLKRCIRPTFPLG